MTYKLKNSTKNDFITVRFRNTPVGIHFFRSPAKRVASPRKEELAELIVMLDGQYAARMGNSLLLARPGDVVFWPPQATRVEENDPAKPTECVSVYFRWPAAPHGLTNRVHDSGNLIRLLALRLLALKDEPEATGLSSLGKAYLAAILAEYTRLARQTEDPLVARVADYVERNLARPFPLQELAAAMGLNRFYLGRTFKEKTGLTPMAFVRGKRVEHAIGMFSNKPGFTMRMVAARVGLSDDIQLRRLLKRYTGIHARAFIKLARSKSAGKYPLKIRPSP